MFICVSIVGGLSKADTCWGHNFHISGIYEFKFWSSFQLPVPTLWKYFGFKLESLNTWKNQIKHSKSSPENYSLNHMCIWECPHHMRFLPWLALRTGLAAVAGLVEELVFAAAGVLSTNKQTRHLGGRRDRQVESRVSEDKCENSKTELVKTQMRHSY